ncbi:hypothetical protein LRS06_02105 [Hymenobacter sp. J193]|uniref:hypothetical protein n=1 Tax=Hymenobacter sp. J193 TaxID=2898429 RepID=UPI0021511116|nr:hypothetical protein [Hymenobacter sp. J193]MCR5886584.1 hypothetical protein [Hymenobacter sp. J193]
MKTYQQNQLTMYGAVLRFLAEDGAALAAIKRIGAGRVALAAVVTRLQTAAAAQDQNTTEITQDRRQVKAEAAGKAEALRLLVVALTPDAALRGELKQPLSKTLAGKDAELLRYLRRIDEAVGTLAATDLTDAGYDPKVRTALQADIKTLTDTQGEARQVITGASTATDTLETLLEEAKAVLDEQLDPLVLAQRLKHPELVAQYEAVRRLVKTAARRTPQYRGVAHYNQPVLVFDRRTAGLTSLTLGNRSGKGIALRYYTAAEPTARPAEGQGLLVKHKTDVHLSDYGPLGDAEAPYLLVLLEQVDGEGRWVVR